MVLGGQKKISTSCQRTWQMWDQTLKPLKTDGTIAGVHDQHLAAAIELAANVGAAKRARHGDGKVDGDLSVAGMHVEIGRKIFRQPQSYVAVTCIDAPATRHFRSRTGVGLNAAIVCLKIEAVPAAGCPNVA